MDEKIKSLLNNTLIYTIGNFGSKILTFALLPLYSYYLNKTEFGNYDLIITTITLAVPIVGFQFSDAIFRWLINHEKENNDKSTIISNGLFILLISIALSAILFWLLSLKYNLQSPILIYLLFLVSIIYPVLQQIIRGLGLNKLFAFSGIVYSFFLVVSTIIFVVFLNYKLDGLLLSSIIANFMAILWLALKGKIITYWDKSKLGLKEIKLMMNYSWPLIPNTISWWLVNSANKYIILFYLGTEFNGTFGLANRFPALLVMINSIFMLAWQESAITNFDDENRKLYFSKIIDGLMWVQIIASSIFAISSEWIVKYFIAKEFYDSWEIMPYLFFGVAFSTFAGFYGTFYLSSKKTKGALYSSVIGGLINVIICYLLIHKYGLQSVSFATFIGYLFLFIIRVFHTKRFVDIQYNTRSLIFLSFITISSLIISLSIYSILKIVLLTLIVAISYVKYKIFIKALFNKLNFKIKKSKT